MKIAIFYPSQEIVAKDLVFCKYTNHQFVDNCTFDTDLIYACSVSVLPQAYAAKMHHNKPLACWCWDIPYNWRDWDMSESGMRINAHRDEVNNVTIDLLKRCDLVISASKWTQQILKKYGISSRQIYFYINTQELDAVSAQNKKRQIIQISRYFYNKKFEHSISACPEDYTLFLVGTGLNNLYGNELERKPNVVFNDSIPRTETIKALKSSELLVSPSVFEGWGITPVEALYCGVPVLLSDLEVFQEVYGDNIIYHQKNNPDDMREKLQRLISDKDLQKKIVNICKPIIAEFTPEKFARRWEKCLT
jgi:glycosyltransferase involved in cell wall biosynthesis